MGIGTGFAIAAAVSKVLYGIGSVIAFGSFVAKQVKNLTLDSTLVTLGAIVLGTFCPECDLAILALDVGSDVLSGISTANDIKSGNVTESTIDVIGDLVSVGSLGADLSQADKVFGEGLHVSDASKEAFEAAKALATHAAHTSALVDVGETLQKQLNQMFVSTAC